MAKQHLWENFESSSFWIDVDSLHPARIDAWYYQPQFIENNKRLQDWVSAGGGTLRRLSGLASVTYGYMPTEDYWESTNGAPFLRVTNFTANLFTNLSDLKYVNPKAKENPKFTLKFGDTIVVQCGNTTGRIAFVSSDIEGFVFPSFCLRVRSRDRGVNPFYLVALFDTSAVQTQIQRTISVTSVRPNTTKPALESIMIPIPDRRIQDYIGAKVELAERCRAEAATLQRQLDIRISELYKGAPSVTGDSLSTLATLDELENDRIDAWHYQRHFINLSKWLRENDYFTRLEKIGNLSRDRWNPTEHPDSTFTYIEISNVNTTTGQMSPNQIEVSKAPSRARKLLKAYDILVSTVRPNRGAISVVPDNLNGAVGSTGFAVVRTRNRNDAYFLSQILKHPISIAQLMRWNTGSAYPAIEEDVVLKVWVPGAKANIRNELGTLEWQRHRLQEEGARLISEAKSDVEALIEGTLDTNAILSGKLKPPTWEDIEKELKEENK